MKPMLESSQRELGGQNRHPWADLVQPSVCSGAGLWTLQGAQVVSLVMSVVFCCYFCFWVLPSPCRLLRLSGDLYDSTLSSLDWQILVWPIYYASSWKVCLLRKYGTEWLLCFPSTVSILVLDRKIWSWTFSAVTTPNWGFIPIQLLQ